MNVKIDLSAMKAAAQKVAGLSLRDEADALRAGVKEALQPVAELARANIQAIMNEPRNEDATMPLGNLKASISVVAKTYQNGDFHLALVGPARGKFIDRKKQTYEPGEDAKDYATRTKGAPQPSRYAHLVELGTKHNPKTKRPNRPKPFLRPAVDQGQAIVSAKLEEAVAKAVERQFNKLK